MQSSNPRHVAIIMDGNGRWARKRLMPRTAGHKRGVEIARQTIEYCARREVEVLTLFAFSSENWSRPDEEVSVLMELFFVALRKESQALAKNNIRLKILGDKSRFPAKVREQMDAAETATALSTGMVLQIAANYGGRMDIVQAARQLAEKVRAGELASSDIDESLFSAHLLSEGQPDPDLFIRTGGESRISNFLLWQLAYAELIFTPVLWPDFSHKELDEAFASFASRERRFGKTSEQVTGHV